ncbi:MAG: B12-binding domain-containing radical SAM protein [bacterium]
MSSLAIHLLYRLINDHPYFSCSRIFLPQDNLPPLSIEQLKPIEEHDIVGFSISYELDYFNVLEILKRSSIPISSAKRDLSHPLIIGGGICLTYNPEPLADAFDLILIGEAEEAIKEVLDRYVEVIDSVKSREDLLLSFRDIEGIYIPRFYRDGKPILEGLPIEIKRRVFRNFDRETAYTCVKTIDTIFGDMFLIEIERGCPMMCKFCVAGNIYLPCRIKSIDTVKRIITQHESIYSKVGLMGPLVGGIHYIKDLLKWLIDRGLKVSIASLRVSTLDREFLELLKLAGETSITIAPEFINEDIRASLGKKESSEKILEALETSFKVGFKRAKLYMIFGYGDYELEIKSLEDFKRRLDRLLKDYKAYISFNFQPLIPKPFTPLESYNSFDKKALEGQKRKIIEVLKGERFKVNIASIRESLLEIALSRGDRKLFPLILCKDLKGIMKMAFIPFSPIRFIRT